jgi:very-short-patch-repair endonuclease
MKRNLSPHDKILRAARDIRHNATQAEEGLWVALRGRRLAGLKFRRQEVIGPFIADFYCASARLIVEVDGDIHDDQ